MKKYFFEERDYNDYIKTKQQLFDGNKAFTLAKFLKGEAAIYFPSRTRSSNIIITWPWSMLPNEIEFLYSYAKNCLNNIAFEYSSNLKESFLCLDMCWKTSLFLITFFMLKILSQYL